MLCLLASSHQNLEAQKMDLHEDIISFFSSNLYPLLHYLTVWGSIIGALNLTQISKLFYKGYCILSERSCYCILLIYEYCNHQFSCHIDSPSFNLMYSIFICSKESDILFSEMAKILCKRFTFYLFTIQQVQLVATLVFNWSHISGTSMKNMFSLFLSLLTLVGNILFNS